MQSDNTIYNDLVVYRRLYNLSGNDLLYYIGYQAFKYQFGEFPLPNNLVEITGLDINVCIDIDCKLMKKGIVYARNK